MESLINPPTFSIREKPVSPSIQVLQINKGPLITEQEDGPLPEGIAVRSSHPVRMSLAMK